ncbi:hypothetical protein, partial [Escherichia coli]|uniref:hypothetical protein n=2 Tax=Pseudomonadota TaxID=1224 RepID=UPI003CF99DD7
MRIFVSLAVVLALPACSGAAVCEDKLVEAKPQPHGLLAAFLFVRDCGATADFATHVAVGVRADGLAGATTIFIADSDHGAARVEPNNAIWASVGWLDTDRLSLAYAKDARVFRREQKALGVKI